MASKRILPLLIPFVLIWTSTCSASDRKVEYIRAVVGGEGLMEWQKPGVSEEEKKFRDQVEERKTKMLRRRDRIERPTMFSKEALARLQSKIENDEATRGWLQSSINLADYIIEQGPGYVEKMIPTLTPCNSYGFTCPSCVGEKSQEAVGSSLIRWSHLEPNQLSCRECGHVYPSEEYPETATLQAPRSGQSFTYYLNDREKANPENRTGDLAYHWVGYPVHVSFTGIIREKKIAFMKRSLTSLSFAYQFTKKPIYAEKTKEVMLRFAECYSLWLYHDYWDTIADCDPLYAAWHHTKLPIEWKRHLSSNAFRKDSVTQAAMLQTYWGCGRTHPSTDGISGMKSICVAYDFVADAERADGSPVWSDEEKLRVERDFILEYVIGAEPYVGGEGHADEENNKAPRIYHAQAAVAKCLGIPELADVAIRGYEIVRDNSFLYDGMSTESPSYTNMYLSQLIAIPETLYGFQWDKDFPDREGVYDPYSDDTKLELMYRSILDQLGPDYKYLPLSDTHVGGGPSRHIIEYGLKRYPKYFRGKFPALTGGPIPDQFGRFHLDPMDLEEDQTFQMPEIYFPAWMTSIFRHGEGSDGSVLTLAFNPKGGHRHHDNLALYYFANDTGVLGDLGYVGDMPINKWIRSTKSHNLVVVDDSDQLFWGAPERVPKLNLLATTPKASFVEAESMAYPQCSEYRRLVLLLKGPDGKSFAVDVFRVEGGDRHDYRLYSEIASSDTKGELRFEGIEFPDESPLPSVGSSLAQEDIFGLRDLRSAVPSNKSWRAIWSEEGRAFRFWNLSEADEATASNAPGQRSLEEAGRRVRYLDVTRKGEKLESVFVGIHEPTDNTGEFFIREVEQLPVSSDAGQDAVALRIDTDWGNYTVFNEFENATEVSGFTFKGKLGIYFDSEASQDWILATSAETFLSSDRSIGFENRIPSVLVEVESADEGRIVSGNPLPDSLRDCPDTFQNYFLANDGEFDTGFPIKNYSGDSINIDRFPLPPLKEGTLPNLVYQEEGITESE